MFVIPAYKLYKAGLAGGRLEQGGIKSCMCLHQENKIFYIIQSKSWFNFEKAKTSILSCDFSYYHNETIS